MTSSLLPASPKGRSSAIGKRLTSWLIFIATSLYFLIPLGATFYWSLRGKKDVLGFEAYRKLFADTNFLPAFSQSILNAIATIILCLLIVVPTAYWVTLRLPKLRPIVEFITLLPFVIPAVVLVFGIILQNKLGELIHGETPQPLGVNKFNEHWVRRNQFDRSGKWLV